MNDLALPSYPLPEPSRVVDYPPRRVRRLTPRQVRALGDLAKLAGIVALLLWVRQTADTLRHPVPPSPEPLPFAVVAARFDRVDMMMPADKVFALLGPERFEQWEPEMRRHEVQVWAHPDRYPEPRSWAKWADPADRGRWVAVYLCRGRVYQTLKRGV